MDEVVAPAEPSGIVHLVLEEDASNEVQLGSVATSRFVYRLELLIALLPVVEPCGTTLFPDPSKPSCSYTGQTSSELSNK